MPNNQNGRNHILHDDANRPSWQAADERATHGGRLQPRFEEREIDRGRDDRFAERGSGYWDDRSERGSTPTGYGDRIGATGTGGHRGKGPKGFTRSDERIKECVGEALTDDDLVDASHIEVSVKDGEVTLTGYVEDRTMKRAAEGCVDRIPGVKDVHNQLRIGARDLK